MIYFIQESGTYLIKIGFTGSGDPNARKEMLQTGSPHKLSVLLTLAGGVDREKQIHRQFKSSHARGEWFYPTAEIINFMINNWRNNLAPLAPSKVDPKLVKEFNKLCDLEPRLIYLLKEAEAFEGSEDPDYCRIHVWYGYGKWNGFGFKQRVCNLVGFDLGPGANPELRSPRAYDIAYDRVESALPDCRAGCLCGGPL